LCGFSGGGSSSPETLAHTHNQALANDGGDLSETLTDMNGVALYSLITDNSAAVAANTANIATNTAAIAAMSPVPSGLIGIWNQSIASIPAGWSDSGGLSGSVVLTQPTINADEPIDGTPRTAAGMQFNAGNVVVGENPVKVTWYLERTNSPTGIVYSRITDSSGVTKETSTTLLDPSTLTTVPAAYAFDFSGTTAIVADDMIIVEYAGTGAANPVQISIDTTGAISNGLLRQNKPTTTGWTTLSGQAAGFIIESGLNQTIIKS